MFTLSNQIKTEPRRTATRRKSPQRQDTSELRILSRKAHGRANAQISQGDHAQI